MLSYGDSKADTACNLECVEHLPPIHEFVGPVKITLMDVPKSVYTKKKWIAALIAFAEMLIGATVIMILFYTLKFATPLMMNLHIVLCTIGMQLLMPSAILMINGLHGPTAVLKTSDRKCQHMFLQCFVIICIIGGTLTVLLLGPGTIEAKLESVHCLAGLTACGLAALALLFGPSSYCIKVGRVTKNIHALLGVMTFTASSVCFCLGIYSSKTLKKWLPNPNILNFLILFCIIYTSIVIIVPMLKICGKALP